MVEFINNEAPHRLADTKMTDVGRW
jgi:hypothetical protein